ncbi:unnamed protein product [Rotaria sp. Silwood1]|nr:unnamed protein product [Rotaria sp. Silwood1]
MLSDGSQSKDTKNSTRNYQYSTPSKQTACQSLNSSAVGAAQQHASRTATMSSAKIVQHCQGGLKKQKLQQQQNRLFKDLFYVRFEINKIEFEAQQILIIQTLLKLLR